MTLNNRACRVDISRPGTGFADFVSWTDGGHLAVDTLSIFSVGVIRKHWNLTIVAIKKSKDTAWLEGVESDHVS